jgi:glutaredoxin
MSNRSSHQNKGYGGNTNGTNINTHLFYSKNCQQCTKIINYLQEKGLMIFITAICVDTLSLEELEKLKLNITTVPTLTIGTGNGWMVHQGSTNCWKYIETIVSARKQNMKEIANGRMNAANADRGGNAGPVAYKDNEMGESCKDDYSFLDLDVPLIKNHRPFMNEGEDDKIVLFHVSKKDVNSKFTDEQMRKMVNNEKNKRRTDEEKIKKVNEQTQIQSYMDRNM